MAVSVEPKAFHPTEHAFIVSCEFNTNTRAYVEYSSLSDFTDNIGGSSDYGISATANIPVTHLVPVDPSVAGPGDIVYYRLKIWSSGQFTNGSTYSVRLRRPRSADNSWGFIVGPNGRDDISSSGLSNICQQYYLPTVNSLNVDFICCPGGNLNNPNSGDAGISTARSAYRTLRNEFAVLDIPIFLSPGNNENEQIDDNRQARLEYFPCANLRTSGHQCIRAGQDEWQLLESGNTVPPGVSAGSYYSYSWGNALFIHLNEYLNGSLGSGPDFDAADFDNQKNWLEAVLKEHRHKYKWCFMFTHSSVDESDPNNTTIADHTNAKNYLMDIHSSYKITAHFHGEYAGWRLKSHSNGTIYVCSTFGETLGTDSGEWNSEHGFAYVRIGSDENNNIDKDKVSINIIGVGNGNEKGDVLGSATASYSSGAVINHNNEIKDISNVQKGVEVLSLGSSWVYNDENHPVNDDVNYLTASEKFYLSTFSPSMFNDNFSGTTSEIRRLWKRGSAPFVSDINEVVSDWGAYFSSYTNISTSPLSVSYSYPPWSTPTTIKTIEVDSSDYVGNPIYFLSYFDIPNDITPTEIQLIYNLRDVGVIWINGELAHHTSGVGTIDDEDPYMFPFTETRRPSIDEDWIVDGGSTLSTFEPFSTDNDGSTPPTGNPVGSGYNNSRTKLPNIQYEAGEQPVKIDDVSVINKLKNKNNVVAVLLVLGRDSSSEISRYAKSAYFDLSVTVLGTPKTTLFAPRILTPEKFSAFNIGEVSITWDINDPASSSSSLSSSSVTYEIEYTDNYIGSRTNWHTVKRRISYNATSYEWKTGKSIKSSNIRIRMRAVSSYDESVSDWVISDQFSVNVFELLAPAIVSPLPKYLYTDFILIILDESLTKNTYHQKVRYTLEYSSEKLEIDWTTIVSGLPVGQNIIRWNLDGVASSDDYVLRLTVKNSSTSCLETEESEPDQIARRFVHDINIQQSGVFLIDTKPPEAVLEIENSTGVTNQLEQIVNIFAEDATTEVTSIRLRECDAGSSLGLGDLEDPYDPLGGCADLSEVISDISKFGKSISVNPKTQWIFEDKSGLKKIEAILTDAGGNTSLQEQIKVFLNVFSSEVSINDFIIVVEQRDKITIDNTKTPPEVVAEPSVFEVVYLITSSGEFWTLEPFARLIWTITSSEPVLLSEFNETVYVFTYNEDLNKGYVYTHNITDPTLLFTFTDSDNAGKNRPSAVAVFNGILYIGMESGDLWSYTGIVFTRISTPIVVPIKTMFGDNQYLHIGFNNSDQALLYNGTSFTTLTLE